jgi:hypothetical protein
LNATWNELICSSAGPEFRKVLDGFSIFLNFSPIGPACVCTYQFSRGLGQEIVNGDGFLPNSILFAVFGGCPGLECPGSGRGGRDRATSFFQSKGNGAVGVILCILHPQIRALYPNR